ncbi:MAG TPA: hypothetical protein VNM48_01885, partial [Chloroflexota bacterium]|nr:hypothetical protein [Chloroflexota bacterium]
MSMNRYRAVNDYQARPDASLGPLFDHAAEEGQRRKAAGIAKAEQNAGLLWMSYAQANCRDMLAEREEITADDIREVVVQSPPEPNGDKSWGPLTKRLLDLGWIVPAAKRPR